MQVKVNGFVVSSDVLNKRFRPCNFRTCGNGCCSDGALVSTDRIKKIKKILPKILVFMRPEAVKMVKTKGFYINSRFSRFDLDPENEHYFTRVVKGKCVFFKYTAEGSCVLQNYCAKNNIRPNYKPPGCWSFPIDSVGNRIVVVKWKGLKCLEDSNVKNFPPIYKSCREELTDFLGRKGYRELLKKVKKIKKN
ncbi:MAG: DUF3109 family protein [Elusimicrobia bacterium]|nr:DUF3109 family protein [Elusimicrobiota bacterium]